MSKLILISVLLCLSVDLMAQGGGIARNRPDFITRSGNGVKRSFGKDIFGNIIVEENRGTNRIMIEIKKNIIDELGNYTFEGLNIFGNVMAGYDGDYKLTVGKDIFGHLEIKNNKGSVITVKEDIFGNFEYKYIGRGTNKTATLKKDIFDAWTYSDSTGNEVKFSVEFCESMIPEEMDKKLVLLKFVNMYMPITHF